MRGADQELVSKKDFFETKKSPTEVGQSRGDFTGGFSYQRLPVSESLPLICVPL